MRKLVSRLLGRTEPTFSEARLREAAAIAAVHVVSFKRGWGEEEISRLLIDKAVVTDCVKIGGSLIGFIVSRLAGGEAEILSIAIVPGRRGRGLSRRLLDLHLRRLAGLGVRALFLEVGETNAPARALYRSAGFYEVGRRQGYYQGDSEAGANALVLRRDLG
jgi:[ribosomal protein S18]-alanine N-acetyltransferase